jgi:hypothetical protein
MMRKNNSFNQFINSHPRIVIFCLAFFYVLLVGLFIQLIFLPHIAPQGMSGGDGLLKAYDGEKFHRISVASSNQIKEFGWSAWKLKPDNQFVSGIASIFYSLFTPKPWVLLPLNGILHGIACLALFEILSIIVVDRVISFYSILPFIFFPSSLLWNAQIHNENYIIPAVLLFLYAWIYLADTERAKNWKRTWLVFLYLVLGSLVIWAIRDSIITILHLLAFITIILLIVLQIIPLIKNQIRIKILFIYAGVLIGIWLLSSPVIFNKIDPGYVFSSKSDDMSSSLGLDLETTGKSKVRVTWTETPWLPKNIDDKFNDLSHTRAKFIKAWSYAGSQIDTEVVFHQASDVLFYFPRAMEISFLAPFPTEWLASGYKKGASLMRKESGFEMLIIYVCLLGLLFSVWHFRTKTEIWILLIISIGMLMVYTCAIPNVGALYRFRYPYLMPIVCLGLAGVILILQKISIRRNQSEA